MYPKKYDLGFLLDDLRSAYTNNKLDQQGNVFDKNGEKLEDRETLIITQSSMLYCLAYRCFIEKKQEDANKMNLIALALNDKSTFNSFMNICISEYKMYNSIGTKRVLYVPFEEIANYLFSNPYRKEIIEEYVENVAEEYLNQNEKEYQKIK